jgi:hypothetical protein
VFWGGDPKEWMLYMAIKYAIIESMIGVHSGTKINKPQLCRYLTGYSYLGA